MMQALVTCVPGVLVVLLLYQSAHPVGTVTEDDVKECGSDVFRRVECRSATLYYTECPVPGATTIHLIKLHRNFSARPCDFKVTFGFRATAVWVTDGCSGEFYICYEGESVSSNTSIPSTVTTVTATAVTTNIVTEVVSPPNTTAGDGVVDQGSNSPGEPDNAAIYIAVSVSLAVIAGVCFLIGCLLKRRQMRDRSDRLAEKRQKKMNMRKTDDDDIIITPIESRTQSVETLRFHESVVETGTGSRHPESAESVCPQGSGCFPVPKVKRVSLALNGEFASRRGGSIPNISTIENTSTVSALYKLNRIKTCSQSSLSSIQEGHTLHHGLRATKSMSNITFKRPIKYNTVGYSGKATTMARKYSLLDNTLTFPRNMHERKTRAIVHVHPQRFRQPLGDGIKGDTDICQAHSPVINGKPVYAHPDALLHVSESNSQRTDSGESLQTLTSFKPNHQNPLVGKDPEIIYSTVNKSLHGAGTRYNDGASATNVTATTEIRPVILKPALKPKPMLKPKPAFSLSTKILVNGNS